MVPFYYLPSTTFDAWRQTGPIRKLLQGYFIDDGGFVIASIVAVAVAFVFSLAFYLMGRKFSLAKLSVWFIMFFLSGIVSFGLTALSTGTLTNEQVKIGIAKTFSKQKEGIKDKIERENYEDAIKGTKNAKSNSTQGDKLQKNRKIKNPNYLKFADNPVAITVSCLNIFYTLFLFWVFSLILKNEHLKITKFAFDIPHRWPQRK